jgi:hypothetical protein
VPRIPFRPGVPRPKRKRTKKRKTHAAILISRRSQRFQCPICGPIGDLSAGVAHAVTNQFVYEDPAP